MGLTNGKVKLYAEIITNLSYELPLLKHLQNYKRKTKHFKIRLYMKVCFVLHVESFPEISLLTYGTQRILQHCAKCYA